MRKIIKMPDVKRYAVATTVIWTCVLAGMCTWHLAEHKTHSLEIARMQASSSFDKDLVYRRWAVLLGGVYVPVSEKTPLTHTYRTSKNATR